MAAESPFAVIKTIGIVCFLSQS